MTQFKHFLIIGGATGLSWGVWLLFPSFFDTKTAWYLMAVFPLAWGTAFHVYEKTHDVADMSWVTEREHRKINCKLAEVRRRIWRTGAIILGLSGTMFFVLSVESAKDAASPICVGVLVGFGLSILVTLKNWLDELAEFQDKVQARTQKIRRKNAAIARLDSYAKH